MSRRGFLASLSGVAVGCAIDGTRNDMTEPLTAARLRARPARVTIAGNGAGLHRLGLGQERDAYIYIPQSAPQGVALPLAVMLHGAGGNGQRSSASLIASAEEKKFIVLVPESRGTTWDIIHRGFGADVSFIDKALEHVFARHAIDKSRMAVGGFSDGASYALSMGIPNGDLFTDIIAYSPGFYVPGSRAGQPRIFVSHGKGDEVLPIDRCSRQLVPALRRAGYRVEYREFEGGHTVPREVAEEAIDWFLRV